MSALVRPAACLAALLAAGACLAQGPPGQPPATAAASASAPQADRSFKRTVIEDGGARIEETRLRGAAQRITVQSKIPGVAPYEVIVAPGGRDPAQQRGAAGQRAWSIFDF